MLGRALFRDDLRDAFKQALAPDDDRVHVLLSIEADELKPLRRERLAGPLDGGWTPLALDQRTPFALHLPSATDRRFPPISRLDLRALIVVANPTRPEGWQLSPFDVVEAVRGVRASLGPIPSEVLGEVEGSIGPPTLDALCNAITGQPCTLLHVVAHGRFKAGDREPILSLSTLESEVDAVPAGRLIERLGKLRGARGLPHCAFLSTCEGAAPEAEGVLGGLGQRLVRELGMPAVVAMTDKVSVASALALASEFYTRLWRHGLVDLALAESYAGLAGRPDIAVPVPALLSRLAGRPLFSLAPDGDLTDGEIAHGLDRMESLLPGRAPVLLPDFREHATTLRGVLGTDPGQLVRELRAARGRALAGIDQLSQEVLELADFEALANDLEPPSYDGRCPFKGLQSFKPGDRPFFFGRDEWVRRLRERLEQHSFLAVLGPSGSGKSSVVLAGLVPALQDREPGLAPVIFTPGADPLAALEAQLAAAGGRPAVVVVDQFEETFTLCTYPATRQAFFERLLALAGSGRVALTMRADFWGDCAQYPALRERMLAHQELIPPMTPEELRTAMEAQAKAVGLRFEPGLVGTILDDVAGEPGAMPLLQHALSELWNRRHGPRLKAEEYQALGRVQGAIAKTAEDAYDELSRLGQGDRMRDVFLRLVHLDDGGASGELRRDTRRRALLDDLVPAGGDREAVRALVGRLADRRLVVTTGWGEDDRRALVEVAHEALIRHWPRLIAWLGENRATLRLRQEIGDAARAWEQAGRDEDRLNHRGPRLQEAEALAADPAAGLNDLERRYVSACVALREGQRTARERQARRIRNTLITFSAVVTALLVVATVLGFKADAQRRRSERLLTSLAIDEGVRCLQRGEVGPGLAWLARGLEMAPPDLRPDIRRQPAGWSRESIPVREYLGHTGEVTDLAFSPDGKTILSGSKDGTARLWDLATGRPIGSPLRHAGPVTSVAFSTDGLTVLTGGEDKAARIWDAATGQPARSPGPTLEHSGPVQDVAFGADGRTVLARLATKAQLWDLASGRPIGRPLPHQGDLADAIYSPDGKVVVTGGRDQTVRLWDAATGAPRAVDHDWGHGDSGEDEPGRPVPPGGHELRGPALGCRLDVADRRAIPGGLVDRGAGPGNRFTRVRRRRLDGPDRVRHSGHLAPGGDGSAPPSPSMARREPGRRVQPRRQNRSDAEFSRLERPPDASPADHGVRLQHRQLGPPDCDQRRDPSLAGR